MGFSRQEYWSVAIPFSRGSSPPRDQTQVSCIAGRFFTIWASREALISLYCRRPISKTHFIAVLRKLEQHRKNAKSSLSLYFIKVNISREIRGKTWWPLKRQWWPFQTWLEYWMKYVGEKKNQLRAGWVLHTWSLKTEECGCKKNILKVDMFWKTSTPSHSPVA